MLEGTRAHGRTGRREVEADARYAEDDRDESSLPTHAGARVFEALRRREYSTASVRSYDQDGAEIACDLIMRYPQQRTRDTDPNLSDVSDSPDESEYMGASHLQHGLDGRDSPQHDFAVDDVERAIYTRFLQWAQPLVKYSK